MDIFTLSIFGFYIAIEWMSSSDLELLNVTKKISVELTTHLYGINMWFYNLGLYLCTPIHRTPNKIVATTTVDSSPEDFPEMPPEMYLCDTCYTFRKCNHWQDWRRKPLIGEECHYYVHPDDPDRDRY